jgi:hypothetical protein
VEHRRSIVPEGALGAFCFAEHVMGIEGRKVHTDARRAHIWRVAATLKIESEANFRTGANARE